MTSQVTKVRVDLYGAASSNTHAAESVTLRFAANGPLREAVLVAGDNRYAIPGHGLSALVAVEGVMTVYAEGPGDRKEGPFHGDHIRNIFPTSTQPVTGSNPLPAPSWHFAVTLTRAGKPVWSRRDQNPLESIE
ncbi:MAG: hypothetical protein HY874_09555 [Chloroflexi bacterium]|nr:hypothetical protein [Chloroflexota bacterium]